MKFREQIIEATETVPFQRFNVLVLDIDEYNFLQKYMRERTGNKNAKLAHILLRDDLGHGVDMPVERA